MKTMMIIAGVAGALAFSGAALAAGAGDGSQASACGAVHGAFADVNGNFGRIGQEFQGAPNYHNGVRGQEPGATGYNNSHTNCQNTPSQQPDASRQPS